jgi:hypothetical protein
MAEVKSEWNFTSTTPICLYVMYSNSLPMLPQLRWFMVSNETTIAYDKLSRTWKALVMTCSRKYRTSIFILSSSLRLDLYSGLFPRTNPTRIYINFLSLLSYVLHACPAESFSFSLIRLAILTFWSLAVFLRPTRFTVQKFYMVLALRWVFCTDLRTDSDLWFIHH